MEVVWFKYPVLSAKKSMMELPPSRRIIPELPDDRIDVDHAHREIESSRCGKLDGETKEAVGQ